MKITASPDGERWAAENVADRDRTRRSTAHGAHGNVSFHHGSEVTRST